MDTTSTLDYDPANPRGKRSGSLQGSGTHDEDSRCDSGLLHDVTEPQLGTPCVVAEEAGAGATELEARLRSAALRDADAGPADDGVGLTT